MRHYYRVTRIADGTLIALMETGLVAFDYETHKTTKWPKKFFDELKNGD
jgi:acyl-CoA thioesterase FadM